MVHREDRYWMLPEGLECSSEEAQLLAISAVQVIVYDEDDGVNEDTFDKNSTKYSKKPFTNLF